MEYTVDQRRAIAEEGKTILVNAGAGSGKTSVLAARVMRKLQQGVDIDRLVILTFTNAAAAEMRSRIKLNIQKDPTLAAQLRRLDNAVISTFDSFMLRIVRQNHYLLNLPRDLEIADSAYLQGMETTVLTETLSEKYAAGEAGFLAAIDRIWSGGDDMFSTAVRLLAGGMLALPDPDAHLEDFIEKHFSDKTLRTRLADFYALIERRRSELVVLIEQAIANIQDIGQEKADAFATVLARIKKQLHLKGYEAFVGVFQTDLPRRPAASKTFDEAASERLSAAFKPFAEAFRRAKKMLESLHAANEDELIAGYLDTEPLVREVVVTTRLYLQKLSKRKRQENAFGFADVMNFAIAILEHHPDVLARYQSDLVEIMIDEYQDTNDLQDHLIDILASNNAFMVGDVKQSIYGFRDANPDNFRRKCQAISAGAHGCIVDLRENFRSRKEVLDAVNRMFERVMDESIGGVDYQNRQALVFGNHDYDRLPDRLVDHQPVVITYDPGEGSAVRAEAKILASLIRADVDGGVPVLDSTKHYRPCTYGDFCILVDRKTDFAVYENALVTAGIPVYAVADETFMASVEIQFVLNLLKLVRCQDDPEYAKLWFRHALYGTARSFVFALPDDEVLPVLTDRSLSGFTPSMPASLQMIAALVADLAMISRHLPADKFLLRLYADCDIYRKAASLPDPGAVEAKLDYLADKAAALPMPGFAGLLDYINAIQNAKSLDIEFARPLIFGRNAVYLMTMHKAKGLEFPICLYPGLSKRFNRADTHGFFLFDKRLGLLTKAWDDGFKDTFTHILFRETADREYISERIRLFYVALTRAREKIYLLLNVAKEEGETPTPDSSGYLPDSLRLGYGCYADLVRSVVATVSWRMPAPAPVTSKSEAISEKEAIVAPNFIHLELTPVSIIKSGFA
ncbi:MAG: UvrD-helicase domain-containing protein, partial [bacterium]